MSRIANKNTRRLSHYRCEQYPNYTFCTSNHITYRVGISRGLDPLIMVDLLVGEILNLEPFDRKTTEKLFSKGEEQKLFKIMTIDMSSNCRKALVNFERVF